MSCDTYFVPYTATAIASIMENAHETTHYEIYVLTSGVPDDMIQTMTQWFKKYPHGTLHFIDVDSRMDELGRDRFHVTPDITLATYFRFLAPTLFAHYSRILYLDADLVALTDLRELYQYDLAGKAVGACHDIWQEECYTHEPRLRKYFTDTLKMAPEDGYFNAGILLMNLDVMRTQNIEEKLFDAVDRIPQPYLKDQDILNSVCKGNVCYLPAKWNLVDWMADPSEQNETFHFANAATQEQCRQVRQERGILHYMGTKPWAANYDGTLDHEYWRYSKNTPFHEIAVSRLIKASGVIPSAKTFFHSGFHVLRSLFGCWFGSAGKKEKNVRRIYRFKRQMLRSITRRKTL